MDKPTPPLSRTAVILVCLFLFIIYVIVFSNFIKPEVKASNYFIPKFDKTEAPTKDCPTVINLPIGLRLKSFDLYDSTYTTAESSNYANYPAKGDSVLQYYRDHGDTIEIYNSQKIIDGHAPPVLEKKLVFVFIQH